MNDIKIQKHDQKIADLARQRQRIIQMDSEQALNAILDAPSPLPLVHSFSEEDFFLLIHEIGVEDAVPILSMASSRQLEYLLDMEIWETSLLNTNSFTKWLAILLEADPNRLLKWIINENIETFELYLFKNIEIRIREHDEEPSNIGDEYFTLDDIFYIKFRDYKNYDISSEYDQKRKIVVSRILDHIAAFDYVTYQNIIHESSSIIPGEFEEDLFRLRNVRLAEKGFMPFDEAFKIYTPVRSNIEIRSQIKSSKLKSNTYETVLPAPLFSSNILKENNLFSQAISFINVDSVIQEIQLEFATLCNLIVSADKKVIRDKKELKEIIQKACRYINIGIEFLLKKKQKKVSPQNSAVIIKNYLLSYLFRQGHTLGLEIKWKTEKWLRQSWFSENNLSLSFWDEQWMGVLGGVLLEQPMFFNNYEDNLLYREFNNIDEIQKTEQIIDAIISMDQLFSVLDAKIKNSSDLFLTYKKFILTLWARNFLQLPEEFSPITFEQFKSFFELLWINSQKETDDFKYSTKIKLSAKTGFLQWLSTKSGLHQFEITDHVGISLESIFNDIESEYGHVHPKDLDPKYITLFCIK